MLSVWKFNFPITDKFEIEMPRGAQITLVEAQGQIPTMWAIIETDADIYMRKFNLYGTGHNICQHSSDFIASFQAPPYVWHLFSGE